MKRTSAAFLVVALVAGFSGWTARNYWQVGPPRQAVVLGTNNEQSNKLADCEKKLEKFKEAREARREAYDLSQDKQVWTVAEFYGQGRETSASSKENTSNRTSVFVRDISSAFEGFQNGMIVLTKGDPKYPGNRKVIPITTNGISRWKNAIIKAKKVRLAFFFSGSYFAEESQVSGDYLKPIIVQ